jgi:hypothetical protein
MAFRDLFFVKYSVESGGQPGLDIHRDGSIISFNILLNDPVSEESFQKESPSRGRDHIREVTAHSEATNAVVAERNV